MRTKFLNSVAAWKKPGKERESLQKSQKPLSEDEASKREEKKANVRGHFLRWPRQWTCSKHEQGQMQKAEEKWKAKVASELEIWYLLNRFVEDRLAVLLIKLNTVNL